MNEGKNKRRQIECYDAIHSMTLSVDSVEEVDTLSWLVEACQLSVVNDFSYQPPSFQLFDAVQYQDINNKTRTLFREHKYTSDWMLWFTPSSQLDLAKEFKVSYSELSCSQCSVLIDSKGTFNTTERAFGYNQKWVWQQFKVFVYKLVPKKFFAKFGVPQACRMTKKTNKLRKMFQGLKTMPEVFHIPHA